MYTHVRCPLVIGLPLINEACVYGSNMVRSRSPSDRDKFIAIGLDDSQTSLFDSERH